MCWFECWMPPRKLFGFRHSEIASETILGPKHYMFLGSQREHIHMVNNWLSFQLGCTTLVLTFEMLTHLKIGKLFEGCGSSERLRRVPFIPFTAISQVLKHGMSQVLCACVSGVGVCRAMVLIDGTKPRWGNWTNQTGGYNTELYFAIDKQ